jgi:hypothetical protein
VPETDAASSILPIHIEETIRSIAGLNTEHRERHAPSARRGPRSIAVGPREVHRDTHCFRRRVDEPELLRSRAWLSPARSPPFAWLAGASLLASLYLVILILTTQIGEDRLTQCHELLNLELAILTGAKDRQGGRTP